MRPRVTAVKPVLLALFHPKTVARRARSVRLRVRANVATTLRAAGRSYRVGPRRRSITVRLPRRGTRVRFRLKLGRGKLSSSFQVALKRR